MRVKESIAAFFFCIRTNLHPSLILHKSTIGNSIWNCYERFFHSAQCYASALNPGIYRFITPKKKKKKKKKLIRVSMKIFVE